MWVFIGVFASRGALLNIVCSYSTSQGIKTSLLAYCRQDDMTWHLKEPCSILIMRYCFNRDYSFMRNCYITDITIVQTQRREYFTDLDWTAMNCLHSRLFDRKLTSVFIIAAFHFEEALLLHMLDHCYCYWDTEWNWAVCYRFRCTCIFSCCDKSKSQLCDQPINL